MNPQPTLHPIQHAAGAAKPRPGYHLPFLAVLFALTLLAALFITRLAIAGFEIFVRDAGKSTDQTPITVTVGDVRLDLPQNKIRSGSRQRSSGAQLDLFLHWPSLDGFTTDRATDFQSAAASSIVYVTLQPQEGRMSPEERFRRLYPRVLTDRTDQSAHGFVIREFRDGHGYDGERLYIARDPSHPLAARCDHAAEPLGPLCIVRFRSAGGLDVTYRFRHELMADWREIDETVRGLVTDWTGAEDT